MLSLGDGNWISVGVIRASCVPLAISSYIYGKAHSDEQIRALAQQKAHMLVRPVCADEAIRQPGLPQVQVITCRTLLRSQLPTIVSMH